MGAINQQAPETANARIVFSAGNIDPDNSATTGNIALVEHLSSGVIQFTFQDSMTTLEQTVGLTLCGTDPTADGQVEIVGGGPEFTQLIVNTNLGGFAADVDFFFWVTRVRTS